MTNYAAPDLSKQPPRSPRVRLGGYVLLPRMLDKCRAEIAGTSGEFHYACPIDQRFLEFTGINADELKTEVAKGIGDGEVLAWIEANAPVKHSAWEVAQWSAFSESAPPSGNEERAFISSQVEAMKAAHREDVSTWFDYLDLDDLVTFGGRP